MLAVHRFSLTVHSQVSLRLNPLAQFEKQPKEYVLTSSRREQLLPKRPRNAFVFSEKDMPGYKKRLVGSREEESSNYHARSYLYEKNKRDSKRKENRKRFEPYTRRPIPKQTAIAGIISREFECAPVENEEYWQLERLKAELMLKPKEQAQTTFENLKDATYLAPGTVPMYGKTTSTKVGLLFFPRVFNLLTLYSKNRNEKRLPRRIVPLAYPRTSSLTCYSTCSNIINIGVSESSRRKRISQILISVRSSTRSPRCGKVAI